MPWCAKEFEDENETNSEKEQSAKPAPRMKMTTDIPAAITTPESVASPSRG
jgi:hypothetical protein